MGKARDADLDLLPVRAGAAAKPDASETFDELQALNRAHARLMSTRRGVSQDDVLVMVEVAVEPPAKPD